MGSGGVRLQTQLCSPASSHIYFLLLYSMTQDCNVYLIVCAETRCVLKRRALKQPAGSLARMSLSYQLIKWMRWLSGRARGYERRRIERAGTTAKNTGFHRMYIQMKQVRATRGSRGQGFRGGSTMSRCCAHAKFHQWRQPQSCLPNTSFLANHR